MCDITPSDLNDYLGFSGNQLNLENLDNVTITNVADNQIISYDAGTATWINTAAGGIDDINEISNVTITSVADNEVLVYSSATATWINNTFLEAGIPTVTTGTFTPTISGTVTAGSATYAQQNGTYIRIDNHVWIYGNVIWTSHTGAGGTVLGGLPFTIDTEQSANSVMTVGAANWSGSVNNAPQRATFTPNTTNSTCYGDTVDTAATIDTAATLWFSGMYRVKDGE